MRAPRWLKTFSAWRWAPFVALVAAALVFVLLALMLIPVQYDSTPRAALNHSAEGRDREPQRTLTAASPALAQAASAAAEPPITFVHQARPSPPAPLPAPALDEAPARAAVSVDFGANNADRGDRPGARAQVAAYGVSVPAHADPAP